MKKIILFALLLAAFTSNAQPSYQSLLKDFRGKAIELNKVTKNVSDEQIVTLMESSSDIKQKAQAVVDALNLIKKNFPAETMSGLCETACGAQETFCFAFCHGQACAVCVLAYARCIANCGL